MDGQRKEGGNLPVAEIPEVEEGQLLHTPEEVFALAAKVFGNDLIRDIIVDHAIHQDSGSLDIATVCILRALGKDWNDSVCRRLHKNAEALYQLILTDSFGQDRIHLNGKVRPGAITDQFLDQFSKTFACSSRVLGRSPTIQLVTWKTENGLNCESLYNFLLECGQGLVKIQLEISADGLPIKANFANLSLPSLRKAAFRLNFSDLDGRIRHSDNVIHCFQSILNATGTLKELDINQFERRKQPSIFESIVFPPTVTQIHLTEEFDDADGEILLLKNFHPNLTSLSLTVCKDSVAKGLLSRILHAYRMTLKKLSLSRNWGDPDSLIRFRFPIMEKLEVFETWNENIVPESTGIGFLETYLPKLKTLGLSFPWTENGEEYIDGLNPWSNGLIISSVEKLRIAAQDVYVNLDAELLGQLHFSFPNVTKLELRFTEIYIAAVEYIFMEMSNLVDLKIVKARSYVDYEHDKSTVSNWESVLIGASFASNKALWASQENWNKMQLNIDEYLSIRKLTNLRRFTLEDNNLDEVVTDRAFHFAFLKMPELQKLEFSGKCSISPEICDKWRMSGRILKFPPGLQ